MARLYTVPFVVPFSAHIFSSPNTKVCDLMHEITRLIGRGKKCMQDGCVCVRMYCVLTKNQYYCNHSPIKCAANCQKYNSLIAFLLR